ncbi:GvpL/GvpF family gas vesicle protein [Streptosporangium sp. NPDC020072]|uniref:GvpL/GvpF family gas vesicle protein n=1 Tax=Streptosporangium jomthongense TaxID=1193683 RepID=A0ABV8EY67_9ACTN
MPRSTKETETAGTGEAVRQVGGGASYVYGIVPGDTEVDPDARGVGDPPGRIRLVRHGEIAALTSEIALDRPLGRPEDLFAHQRLLDEAAAEVPVLPLRFGAVLTDDGAVVDELLAPNHDAFRDALDDLEGRTEYIVRGRYVEPVVIGEVLAENAEASRLLDGIRGKPEDATWDARIRLGELLGEGVAARRDADTEEIVGALAPLSVAVAVREPTHEQDAVHAAFLIETDRSEEFERAVEEFGDRWADRVTVRLLGPLAPYDFVTTSQAGEG